ncbi:hypothetical protein KAU33_03560 [Candidatus Dependentiae bacterium]|nr:hypothetical protein [Candidatus Dependentiae bacterium]
MTILQAIVKMLFVIARNEWANDEAISERSEGSFLKARLPRHSLRSILSMTIRRSFGFWAQQINVIINNTKVINKRKSLEKPKKRLEKVVEICYNSFFKILKRR